MSTIINAINTLPEMVSVGGASEIMITDAELQLRLNFAEEYRDYLAEFCAVAARGIELTGIIDAEYYNVVSATKQEWELNPKIPHSMYVVEKTGVDGIIIWQDTQGLIYQSSPNVKPKQIAESLTEYILNRTK